MTALILPAAAAAAATVCWLAKLKSGAHDTERQHGVRRRYDTRLILTIVMTSSISFLLGSNLTLLFHDNTSFNWASEEVNRIQMEMGPPCPYRQGSQTHNIDVGKAEHYDNGRLYEQRPAGKFPTERKHIISHGAPRSASTLLFNIVGVSNFLHLRRHKPELISYIEPKYMKKEESHDRYFSHNDSNTTMIYKTHENLDKFLRYDVIIFTTTMTDRAAALLKSRLEEQGHNVAYVQSMQTLLSEGIPRIVHDFVFGYDLSKEDEENMVEYFSKWEILRQCCGKQMSRSWRNDQTPDIYKESSLVNKHHPFCKDHDIDEVEKSFMETRLYAQLDEYPNMRKFNKPSLRDEELNGTYCSSYNKRIKSEALGFYGQPRVNENIKIGDWSEDEHQTFLEGLAIHGSNEPHKIAEMLKTRTPMQVNSHLEEYLQEKLRTTLQNEGIGRETMVDNSLTKPV